MKYVVKKSQVPAKRIRLCDYIPFGGSVVAIKREHTWGLFPKSYVTLTMYTKEFRYVTYTVESHIPVDVERTYTQIVRGV